MQDEIEIYSAISRIKCMGQVEGRIKWEMNINVDGYEIVTFLL